MSQNAQKIERLTFAWLIRLYKYRATRSKGAGLRRPKLSNKSRHTEGSVQRDYFYRSFRSAIMNHASHFNIPNRYSKLFWLSALKTWGNLEEVLILEARLNSDLRETSPPIALRELLTIDSGELFNDVINELLENKNLLTLSMLTQDLEIRCLILADYILKLVANYAHNFEVLFKKLSEVAISLYSHSESDRAEDHDFNIIWVFSILDTFEYINKNISHPHAELLIRTTPLIASKAIFCHYYLPRNQ